MGLSGLAANIEKMEEPVKDALNSMCLSNNLLPRIPPADSRVYLPRSVLRCNKIDETGSKVAARVFQKLSMLPNAAAELASWTWSPRLRHNFQKPLKFTFVSPTLARRRPIAGQENLLPRLHGHSGLYPLDTEKMKNVPMYAKGIRNFEKNCRKLVAQTAPSQSAAEGAPSTEGPDGETRAPRAHDAYRHAELAVLLYATAMQQHTPGMHACSYIGVSKLTCLCCQKFLDAYNRQQGTTWATGGTHGKLYQWGFLSETEPQQQQQSDAVAVAADPDYAAAGCTAASPTDAASEHKQFGSILAQTLTAVAEEFAKRCTKAYAPYNRPSDAASDSGAESGTKRAGRDYESHGGWEDFSRDIENDNDDEDDEKVSKRFLSGQTSGATTEAVRRGAAI